jgi:hypothetical protein
MVPIMSNSMRKMDIADKINLIDEMMQHLMANMKYQEKTLLMRVLAPHMMNDLDIRQMDLMMEPMISIMKRTLKNDKERNLFKTEKSSASFLSTLPDLSEKENLKAVIR